MNKFVLFSLLICTAGITSCDDEESISDPGPDLTNAVSITYPTEEASLLLIHNLGVTAQIEPSLLLKKVTVYITNPAGVRSIATQYPVSYDDPAQVEYSIGIRTDKEMVPGEYKLTVEALDYDLKRYRDSVSVKLHNPTINVDEFMLGMRSGDYFYNSDWEGYNLSDGYDEMMFNFNLYILADNDLSYGITAPEWQNFSKDFNLSLKSFDQVDLDKSGALDEDELGKAMLVQGDQSVFKVWDLDQDEIINENEMAKGIFSSWDNNQDQMLQETEYFTKYFTYLRR